MRGLCDFRSRNSDSREEPLTLTLSPEYRGEGKRPTDRLLVLTNRIRPALAVAMLLTACGCAPQRSAPRRPAPQTIESAAPASQPTSQPTTSPSAEAALQNAKTLEARAYETKAAEDFRAAAPALEEAVRLNPDDVELRKSLGYLYLEPLADPARAYPHLAHVARALPDDVGWSQLAARAAAAAGRNADAEAHYRDIIRRDPANVWDRLALAKILVAQKREREAESLLRDALKADPQNEYANLAYAERLLARGERAPARRIAEQVLERNPNSAGAHVLVGDVRRADYDYAGATRSYNRATEIDPNYGYAAREGQQKIDRARAPKIASAFYYFEDTEDLEQAGVFNTATLYLANRLYADVTFNALRFRNEEQGEDGVYRYEEGFGLEYRFSKELAVRGGVSAFQIEGADDQTGFNAGAMWTPNKTFWGFAQYRENDPVNDSIYTVVEGFTQDVVGGGAGVVLTPKLWTSLAASTADYSDGNERRGLKADISYLLLADPLALLRLEYEWIDYEFRDPRYSSPPSYDYVRPIIELEPRLTKTLSLRARLEVPYVVDEADWGVGIDAGPVWKWGEDRELRIIYLRYDLPGDFAPYSGEGFKVTFVYRF